MKNYRSLLFPPSLCRIVFAISEKCMVNDIFLMEDGAVVWSLYVFEIDFMKRNSFIDYTVELAFQSEQVSLFPC